MSPLTERDGRIIIDGQEYYSDYRRGFSTKYRDAKHYLASLTKQIEDSIQARRGGK